MNRGVELINEERQRQIEQEGFTGEHDAQYRSELALAAACYAMPDIYRNVENGTPRMWPFDDNWWKPTPHDRIRELTKAGALIAAEIDRLIARDKE